MQENLPAINAKFLEQFPEFIEFRAKRTNNGKPTSLEETRHSEEQTPEEIIENAYQSIRNNLASELIQQIMDCSPTFFERLVVDLLVKMGYGGTRMDAGQAVGQSGDGGIDGIIKEDRLGLDVLYIQAKRWEGSVGRPEIQKFVGALQGQRAKKGIFVTTSSFSKQAVDYVSLIESNVVLIDGEMLAKLMIDHSIGVSAIAAYEIRRVDSDYFNEA